jgi:ubiquinone/menaquinone biosynthesis C-methylase UbiE
MNSNSRLHIRQIAAWIVAGLFILGFFIARIGAFTGPIASAWFVGTQRLRRGFLWMLGFAVLFGLPHLGRSLPHGGAKAVLAYAGWALLAMVLGILPFTLHRATSPRLPGFLSTFPLPVGAVLFAALQATLLPASIAAPYRESTIPPLPQLSAILGAGVPVFFVCWFAATLVWAWNLEFRTEAIRVGVTTFTAVCVLAGLFEKLSPIASLPGLIPVLHSVFNWLCFAAAAGFLLWAIVAACKAQDWQCRPETLAILQSPATGEPLQLVRGEHGQALASADGERYPVRHGMPDMRRPEDLTGANEKYNHLYEFIGGFYDDTQRVACALAGFVRDAYVMSYLGLLEVKPGDSVLETSVGTGLNFKYLPRGVSLTGIDLSPEMLINCQTNLRRWQLSADLFLGNAESLPFADSSFDVVFHVGGINFFNDRAKAIREMIRVARPGSRILIADETEEHVKAAFERGPVTSSYYRNRKQAVTAPVDLVPAEMLETHLEILNVVGKNRFYALTFRKPFRVDEQSISAPVTETVVTASSVR